MILFVNITERTEEAKVTLEVLTLFPIFFRIKQIASVTAV